MTGHEPVGLETASLPPSSTIPTPRSMLFVPGSRPEWMLKALGSGADGLVLDLEDAVPAAERPAARANIADFIARHGREKPVLVRINSLDSSAALHDLLAIVSDGLTGVMVPKVTSPAEVHLVDHLLRWIESDRGLPVGDILTVPVLETALSLKFAYDIALASPRNAYMGAAVGKGGDIERALGYRWSRGGSESAVYRANALMDVRAAGVRHPMLGVWTSVHDLSGLRAFAKQVRGIGYEGMIAIHPGHIPIINEEFSLTEEELEYHRGLIAAMERAEAAGQAAVMYRGQMVDAAMAVTARSRLAGASNTSRP